MPFSTKMMILFTENIFVIFRFGHVVNPIEEELELSENLTTAPLQCFECGKRPEFLRLLSGNVMLTSIKGHNSLINFRKLTATNPNVDLVR